MGTRRLDFAEFYHESKDACLGGKHAVAFAAVRHGPAELGSDVAGKVAEWAKGPRGGQPCWGLRSPASVAQSPGIGSRGLRNP